MTAEEFNKKYPVGSTFDYFPVLPQRPGSPPKRTFTRSQAWQLGGGQVVVQVDGQAGGVSVSHLFPVNAAQAFL